MQKRNLFRLPGQLSGQAIRCHARPYCLSFTSFNSNILKFSVLPIFQVIRFPVSMILQCAVQAVQDTWNSKSQHNSAYHTVVSPNSRLIGSS